MGKLQQRAWLAWASVALLGAMCAVLGALQYRWIGEIAGAERTRLRDELQARLNTFSRALNQEIASACQTLFPSASDVELLGRERAWSAQYSRWKESHDKIFRRLALAVPHEGTVRLLSLNLDTAEYSSAEWPPEWSAMRHRLLQRLRGAPMPPI